MAQSIRMPVFDERSLNSLFDFENSDSLSELLEVNDIKTTHNRRIDTEDAGGMAPCRPSNQAKDDVHSQKGCDTSTAARLTTLKKRNQQLQRALALSSVQYSKKLAAMQWKIDALEHELEKLKADKKAPTN